MSGQRSGETHCARSFPGYAASECCLATKEQFSDGVGYNWIDTLKAITSAAVTDHQMEHAAERFPINPPQNKEEYYYRSIFEEHFPSQSAARSVPSVPSVACSTAEALTWDATLQGKMIRADGLWQMCTRQPGTWADKACYKQSLLCKQFTKRDPSIEC